jgi:hypothetical protein
MIEIEQLRGLEVERVIDLLLEQKIQPFEIYIPKETSLYNNERTDISVDYLHLAFAGQRLSEASQEFKYHIVYPQDHESVLFEIKTNNLEGLSEALLDISFGYVNDHEDDSYFPEMVSGFEGDIEQKDYKIACPEFIEIYREFMNEEEDEGEDDN